MTFTDVDLSDTHTVTVTGVVASGVTTGLPTDTRRCCGWLTLGTLTDTTGTGLGGSDAWSFSAQDKNFDYLAAGETLTLTYTVQVDDHNGGVVTQNVTITVTGTNDTPVITSGAQSGAITEETNRPAEPRLDRPRHGERRGDLHRCRSQRHAHGDGDRRRTSGAPPGCRQPRRSSWLTLGTLTDTTGQRRGGSMPGASRRRTRTSTTWRPARR